MFLRARTLIVTLVLGLSTTLVPAQTNFTQTGGGSNQYWGTASMWTTNVAPVSGGSNDYVLSFVTNAGSTTNNLGNPDFFLNRIATTVGGTTIYGSNLVFMANSVGVGPTIGGGGTFNIYNNIILSNSLFYVGIGNANNSISGKISGVGNFTNDTSGVLTPAAQTMKINSVANDFVGNWVIATNSGINFAGSGALGAASNNVIVQARGYAYMTDTNGTYGSGQVVQLEHLAAVGGSPATINSLTNGVNFQINGAGSKAIIYHATALDMSLPIGAATNSLIYGVNGSVSTLTNFTIGDGSPTNWFGLASGFTGSSGSAHSVGTSAGVLTLDGNAELVATAYGLIISNRVTGGGPGYTLTFGGRSTITLANTNNDFTSLIRGDSAAILKAGNATGNMTFNFADGNNTFGGIINGSTGLMTLSGSDNSTNLVTGNFTGHNAAGTVVINGGTYLIAASTRYFPGSLTISNGNFIVTNDRLSTITANGIITIVSGSLLVTNGIGGNFYGLRIGNDANGVGGANVNYTVNQSGGNVTVTSGGGIQMGGTTASTTNFYNLSGGAVNSAGMGLVAASNSVTKFVMTDGNLNLTAAATVGNGATFLMYGGVFTNSAGLNVQGSGTFVQTGGVVVVNGMAGYVNNSAPIGLIVLSDGVFTNVNTGGAYTRGISLIASNAANAYFGGTTRLATDGVNATMTLTNGNPNVTLSTLQLMSVGTPGGTGTLNLAAGILTASTLNNGNGNPTNLVFVNFNGGTLRLGAQTVAANAYSTFNVLGGGAVIDTTNNSVTINQSFTNGVAGTDGGLTKLGTGTLILGATNTYTGPTTITTGTLKLGAAALLANTTSIFLNAGATADVSAVTGGFRLPSGQVLAGFGAVTGVVTVATGATVAPGDNTTLGTLTFRNNLILTNNPTLIFELGPTNASDKVIVSSTLSLGGMDTNWFVLSAGTGFGEGTYTLFDATNIIGVLGSVTNFDNIGGYTGYLWLDDTSKDVKLTVVPEPGAGTLVGAGLLAMFLLGRWRRR